MRHAHCLQTKMSIWTESRVFVHIQISIVAIKWIAPLSIPGVRSSKGHRKSVSICVPYSGTVHVLLYLPNRHTRTWEYTFSPPQLSNYKTWMFRHITHSPPYKDVVCHYAAWHRKRKSLSHVESLRKLHIFRVELG